MIARRLALDQHLIHRVLRFYNKEKGMAAWDRGALSDLRWKLCSAQVHWFGAAHMTYVSTTR